MFPAIPEEYLLSLGAELTPEVAARYADKMNLLLKIQLLGRNLGDLDASFGLLLDLGREVLPHDRAALLWQDDADDAPRLRESRGFSPADAAKPLIDALLGDDRPAMARSVLLSATPDPGPDAGAVLQRLGAASLVTAPLYSGGSVAGHLVLLRDRGPAFTRDEAHLLRVFAFAFEGAIDALLQADQPRALAFQDSPTGLFNRRYCEQQLERELDRARRNNEPVVLVMIEVEGLAAFQQAHGHAVGEDLLVDVARLLGRACRKSDTLARCHADHFAAILPKTGKEGAAIFARRAFEAFDAAIGDEERRGLVGGVSLAISAAAYPEDAFSPETVIEACLSGLAKAREVRGQRHYHQYPMAHPQERDEDLLDPNRAGLLRAPLTDPRRLLKLFARLCLEAVPADRVSVMVREGGDLVVRVAYGFGGPEELAGETRIPLTQRTISTWVSQRKEPLLVGKSGDMAGLPINRGDGYRGDSFFSYPLVAGEEVLGIAHFSNRRDGGPFTREDLARFAPVARAITRHLHLSRSFGTAQEAFLRDSLFELVDVLEQQVPGMEGHSAGVSRLAAAVARRLGLDPAAVASIQLSGRLHDIGKVGYRGTVLAQGRALNPREMALTQRHPLLAWKFLEGIPLRQLDRDAILYHHEREDGSGYLHKPGSETPLSSKILAAADVYQALTAPRPYRPAVSPDDAARYLDDHKVSLFEPRVVDALLSVVRETQGSA